MLMVKIVVSSLTKPMMTKGTRFNTVLSYGMMRPQRIMRMFSKKPSQEDPLLEILIGDGNIKTFNNYLLYKDNYQKMVMKHANKYGFGGALGIIAMSYLAFSYSPYLGIPVALISSFFVYGVVASTMSPNPLAKSIKTLINIAMTLYT